MSEPGKGKPDIMMQAIYANLQNVAFMDNEYFQAQAVEESFHVNQAVNPQF